MVEPRKEEKKIEKEEKKIEEVRVTATHDIDFPSIGWGINAGEERTLPQDPKAAALILSNTSIRIIK